MAYRVLRLLGRGGMGVVELAVDGDGTPVARKRIPLGGSAAHIDAARKRIRREAEVLRHLDHPAIVRLIDVEDDGDDVVLVMPYLPGGTLADRVAEGPLAVEEVSVLCDTLLGALAAAHRADVVHRDVKPDNVLFDAAGRAALADFGVARFRDATAGLTASGLVVGTPAFMAPEQARGDEATAASDVFALGATLLYALTGRGPYGNGAPAAVLLRASRGRVAPVPGWVPAPLRRRLRRMLRRDPSRRPSAASLLGGHDGTNPLTVLRRRPRRVSAAAGGLALAVLAAMVVARAGDAGDPAAARPDSAPCVPLPYQPCGAPRAPFTDGRACVEGHGDYDGLVANGCEAAPDTIDGTALDGRLEANLVPDDDVDTYPLEVGDRFHLFCDGTITVTLTPPAGVAQRLTLLRDGEALDEASGADRTPVEVSVTEPNCIGDDSGTIEVRVSSVSGRSAEPYALEASGSF